MITSSISKKFFLLLVSNLLSHSLQAEFATIKKNIMKKVESNSLRGIAGNDFSFLGHISILEALSQAQESNHFISEIAENYLIFYQSNFKDTNKSLFTKSKDLHKHFLEIVKYWPRNDKKIELKAKVINAANLLLIEYLSSSSMQSLSTKKDFSEAQLNFILSMLVNAAKINVPRTEATQLKTDIEQWLERSMINNEITRNRYDFLEQHQSLFEKLSTQGDKYYPLAKALLNPMLGNGEYLAVIKQIFGALGMPDAARPPIEENSYAQHIQALDQVKEEIIKLEPN